MLVNRAIVVDNKRKEMDAKRKRLQGWHLEPTLISVLVSSKVISRGTHLVSGIVDSS
jgi:hypothetical protein